MSDFLPPWVYDLLGVVEVYEEQHASGSACFAEALKHVPDLERDRGRLVSHYNGGAMSPFPEPEHRLTLVTSEPEYDPWAPA